MATPISSRPGVPITASITGGSVCYARASAASRATATTTIAIPPRQATAAWSARRQGLFPPKRGKPHPGQGR